MLIHRLRLKGIGPLSSCDLRLDDLPAGILAIRGANGNGKSCLVGCIPGAMYRDVPGKGPLAGLATDRNSFVEVDFTFKERFSLRQSVDAVSGKGEALLLRADRTPVLGDTKVTSFDHWASLNLPLPATFFSSFFSAQAAAGFLDMSCAERKSLTLEVLDLSRFEVLAEQARANLKAAQDRRSRLQAEATIFLTSGGPLVVGRARDTLEASQKALQQAEKDLGDCRTALSMAEGAHADLLARSREAEGALRRHREASQRASAARTGASEALKRLAEAEGVAGRREAVDAAKARVDEALKAVAAAEAVAVNHDRKAEEAEKGAEVARKAVADARTRYAKAVERRKALGLKMADRKAVEAAVAALPGLRGGLEKCEAAEKGLVEELDRVKGQRLVGAEGRIVGLQDGLGEILGNDSDDMDVYHLIARQTLDSDEQAVKAALDAPAIIKQAEDLLYASREGIRDLRKALRDSEVLAARQGEMDALDSQQAEADMDADAAEGEGERNLESQETFLRLAKEARGAAFDARKSAPPPVTEDCYLAAEAPAVAAAEARLPDLRHTLRIATLEEESAKAALADAPVPGSVPEVPDLSKERRIVEDAERREKEARRALGTAEGALTHAEDTGRRLTGTNEEIAREDAAIWDWTRLAQDLGRNGLQALLIDAAGPELTAIVNDLLRQAFGSRYTITIETTKPRKSDGALMEVFGIRVLDSENGWEGEATGLSGGQRTIVGEALRLALTTLACRRAGVSACTLIRDESGAALDPENAVNYLAMLRRAMALVGARQCLLISHDAQVWSLADAVIGIEEGKVIA